MILIALAIVFIVGAPLAAVCRQIGIPASVGSIGLGLILGTLMNGASVPQSQIGPVFEALANLGIVALLFRVGLRSHTSVLLRKLPEASAIWLISVAISLIAGYAVARHALLWPVATSLVVATAFSATSVAVSAAVWDEAKMLQSDQGQLLIDVAELDDLSAAVLLALLLGLLPAFANEGQIAWPEVAASASIIVTKLAMFVVGCYVFAHFVERHFTHYVCTLSESKSAPTIAILGAGLLIAAAADALGFSLAIGALFAGLAFSRDPEAVRTDGQFTYIYDLLTPFFFVHIGMQTDILAFAGSLDVALILLVVAVLAKIIGTLLPAVFTMNRHDALALSLSMVPRAEIALVVMYACREINSAVVSEEVFASMVLMSLATCVVAPIALRHQLNRAL